MKNLKFFTLLAALLTATPVAAQSEQGVYIFPQAAIAEYSGFSTLKNEALYGLGVGYRLDGPLAVEVDFLTGDSHTQDGTSQTIDASVISARALYHFLETDKVKPFVSFGFGNQDVDIAGGGSEPQVNAGLGVRWKLWKASDARASYNFYDGQEGGDLRRTFNFGLQYQFGGNKVALPAPVVRADADQDGVADSQDQCLGTAAGRAVDARGCARRLDRDGDGVSDARDRCQGTTDRSRRVDSVGCYIAERVIEAETKQMSASFYFDFDSYAIKAEHQVKARDIARFLGDGSNSSIELSGHTDSVGASAYNQKLAADRVQAIGSLLTRMTSVAGNRISSSSFGENRPAADNSQSSSRGQNRRVEAIIHTTK